MKDLRFDDLYSPEYYMDVPGNDGRIAIKKFNYDNVSEIAY